MHILLCKKWDLAGFFVLSCFLKLFPNIFEKLFKKISDLASSESCVQPHGSNFRCAQDGTVLTCHVHGEIANVSEGGKYIVSETW